MSKGIVKKVCDKFSCVFFKFGETSIFYVVIYEGDDPNCMFLIYEGVAGIYMDGQKINHRVAGEPLGENALENNSLRTASAIADTNLVAFKLKRTDYEDIMFTIKKNEKKNYLVFLKSMPIFHA